PRTCRRPRRNQRTRRRRLPTEIQRRTRARHRQPPDLWWGGEAQRIPRRRTAAHRAPGLGDLPRAEEGRIHQSVLRDDRNGSLLVQLPDVARTVARDAAQSLALRHAEELWVLLRTAVRPTARRVGDGSVATAARGRADQ